MSQSAEKPHGNRRGKKSKKMGNICKATLTEDDSNHKYEFENNSDVLCFYKGDRRVYLARILKRELKKQSKKEKKLEKERKERYFLHFIGWKQKYDAWVDPCDIIIANEANLQQFAKYKQSKKANKNKSKSKSKSKNNENNGNSENSENNENNGQQDIDIDNGKSKSKSKSKSEVKEKKAKKGSLWWLIDTALQREKVLSDGIDANNNNNNHNHSHNNNNNNESSNNVTTKRKSKKHSNVFDFNNDDSNGNGNGNGNGNMNENGENSCDMRGLFDEKSALKNRKNVGKALKFSISPFLRDNLVCQWKLMVYSRRDDNNNEGYIIPLPKKEEFTIRHIMKEFKIWVKNKCENDKIQFIKNKNKEKEKPNENDKNDKNVENDKTASKRGRKRKRRLRDVENGNEKDDNNNNNNDNGNAMDDANVSTTGNNNDNNNSNNENENENENENGRNEKGQELEECKIDLSTLTSEEQLTYQRLLKNYQLFCEVIDAITAMFNHLVFRVLLYEIELPQAVDLQIEFNLDEIKYGKLIDSSIVVNKDKNKKEKSEEKDTENDKEMDQEKDKTVSKETNNGIENGSEEKDKENSDMADIDVTMNSNKENNNDNDKDNGNNENGNEMSNEIGNDIKIDIENESGNPVGNENNDGNDENEIDYSYIREPIDIYGAEHLVRLFVKLPQIAENFAHFTEAHSSVMKEKCNVLLKYLANQKTGKALFEYCNDASPSEYALLKYVDQEYLQRMSKIQIVNE